MSFELITSDDLQEPKVRYDYIYKLYHRSSLDI